MADPRTDVQLEHGYVRLANRILEAILEGRFSGTQLRILLALFRLTYGWRRRSVKLTTSELAKYAGSAIGHDVDRAGGAFRSDLRSLVKEGVVLAPDATRGSQTITFGIQKDFTKWGKFSVAEARLKAVWDVRQAHDDTLIKDPSMNGNSQETNQGNERENEPVPESYGMALREAKPENDNMAPREAIYGSDLAPGQATPWPGIRPPLGPTSGHVDAVTPLDSNELQAPKDRKDNERQRTTTTTDDGGPENGTTKDPTPEAIYTLGITTAANRAITKKWGEQVDPLYYGQSSQLAADLMTEGISLDVAQSSIASQCEHSKNPVPPVSINYFQKGILKAAQSDTQRRYDRTAGPVADSESRGGQPRAISAMAIHQTYTPVAERSEFSVHQQYDAERAKASEAWASDPANVTQLTALMATAERENAFLGPKWIARAATVAIGQAAGFPPFDVWRAAQTAV